MRMMMPTESKSSTVVDVLMAKLDATQVAVNRRQPSVAVQLLETFIREVEVQNGKLIDADRAGRLKTQAQRIIDAIVTSSAAKPMFLQAGLSSIQQVGIASQSRENLIAERTVQMAGALASGFKA
jgi:hypothetical protein